MKLGIYKHYKGSLYQVIGLACHTETGVSLVVYQALYGDYRLWVRPEAMFCETIVHNNERINRFTFINNPLTIAATV